MESLYEVHKRSKLIKTEENKIILVVFVEEDLSSCETQDLAVKHALIH